jgi:hypothetical protein
LILFGCPIKKNKNKTSKGLAFHFLVDEFYFKHSKSKNTGGECILKYFDNVISICCENVVEVFERTSF